MYELARSVKQTRSVKALYKFLLQSIMTLNTFYSVVAPVAHCNNYLKVVKFIFTQRVTFYAPLLSF